MYKANLDLGRLNYAIRMKFSITVKTSLGKTAFSKFTTAGDDYLRVAPYPHFVLEMMEETERKQHYNANRIISFDKFAMFRFVKAGEALIKDFRDKVDLFYYDGNTLSVNKDLRKQTMQFVQIPFKKIAIGAIVVEDRETHQLFEGVSLMVNSVDNYATMTITEFEYLISYMGKMDLDLMSMHLINTVLLMRDVQPEKLNNLRGDQLYHASVEQKSSETTAGHLPPAVTSTIPNI